MPTRTPQRVTLTPPPPAQQQPPLLQLQQPPAPPKLESSGAATLTHVAQSSCDTAGPWLAEATAS
jgi:hypothetical protein